MKWALKMGISRRSKMQTHRHRKDIAGTSMAMNGAKYGLWSKFPMITKASNSAMFVRSIIPMYDIPKKCWKWLKKKFKTVPSNLEHSRGQVEESTWRLCHWATEKCSENDLPGIQNTPHHFRIGHEFAKPAHLMSEVVKFVMQEYQSTVFLKRQVVFLHVHHFCCQHKQRVSLILGMSHAANTSRSVLSSNPAHFLWHISKLDLEQAQESRDPKGIAAELV